MAYESLPDSSSPPDESYISHNFQPLITIKGDFFPIRYLSSSLTVLLYYTQPNGYIIAELI